MLFNEYVKGYLTRHGLSGNQINIICQDMYTNNEGYRDGVNAKYTIEELPHLMESLLLVVIDNYTLKYIKVNCPYAWFRPMFDLEHPIRIEYEKDKEV